ncbi:hypothetical protein F4818DRAFT_398564, partial [Hypoxylon cercidicola]
MEMSRQIERFTTQPEGVWPALNAIKVQSHKAEERRVGRLFETFMGLRSERTLETEDDCFSLVNLSRRLVTKAAVSLRMPAGVVEIPDEDLYDDNTRPTYIDFPYGSDEAIYGLGQRPGLMQLSQKLGNTPLPPPVVAKIAEAQAKAPASSGPAVPRNGYPSLPSSIAEFTHKSRSVYFSERDERRREERFIENAKAQILGPPDESEHKKTQADYDLEDQVRAKAIAEFSAHGPPGIEGMETGEAFDRLLYMVMVTHWRCYKAIPVQDQQI